MLYTIELPADRQSHRFPFPLCITTGNPVAGTLESVSRFSETWLLSKCRILSGFLNIEDVNLGCVSSNYIWSYGFIFCCTVRDVRQFSLLRVILRSNLAGSRYVVTMTSL